MTQIWLKKAEQFLATRLEPVTRHFDIQEDTGPPKIGIAWEVSRKHPLVR